MAILQSDKAAEDEMVKQHHQLSGHELEQTLDDSEEQGKPGMLQSVGSQRVGHDLVTKQQQKHKGRLQSKGSDQGKDYFTTIKKSVN